MSEAKKKINTEYIFFGVTDDATVLAKVGEISIRHGHLDHILKMMIKSLANLSVQEAIDSAGYDGSKILRERIKLLSRKRFGEGEVHLKLLALLARAARATDKRNEIIHRLWGTDIDGTPVVYNSDHSWSHPPSVEELDQLIKEIIQITNEMNHERMFGFINQALIET